jgi:hypothetical protein
VLCGGGTDTLYAAALALLGHCEARLRRAGDAAAAYQVLAEEAPVRQRS